MFCSQCRKEIEDNSKFCIFCGCRIRKVNPSNNIVYVKKNKNAYVQLGFIFGIVSFSILMLLVYKVVVLDEANMSIFPLLIGIIGLVFSLIGIKDDTSGYKAIIGIIGSSFSIIVPLLFKTLAIIF